MPSASADAFDGAAELLRAWCDGLTPDPDLTVSAWADVLRILSPRGSSEAGRWRTSRTPYLRAIMEMPYQLRIRATAQLSSSAF